MGSLSWCDLSFHMFSQVNSDTVQGIKHRTFLESTYHKPTLADMQFGFSDTQKGLRNCQICRELVYQDVCRSTVLPTLSQEQHEYLCGPFPSADIPHNLWKGASTHRAYRTDAYNSNRLHKVWKPCKPRYLMNMQDLTEIFSDKSVASASQPILVQELADLGAQTI